jgi:LacI family transcriptional regulator
MGYVTMRDVANEAGVSVPTVSQVINNRGRISQATRSKVLSAVKKLNYIPNSAAQSMRSPGTHAIGLLVPDIRNPFFAHLVSAVQLELSKSGYVCLIGSSVESVEKQDEFIYSLLAQRIDGAILVPQGSTSHGLEQIVSQDFPVVFLDRWVKGMEAVPLVDSDPEPGMLEALSTIHRLGHTRIGFIPGPLSDSPTLVERKETAVRIGRDVFGDDDVVIPTSADVEAALAELIAQGVDTFVFGYSPDTFVGLGYFHRQGLAVGHDVSVVTFDDIPFFELTTPRISVISQQLNVMGTLSAQLLLHLIDGTISSSDTTIHLDQRVPTKFVSRESVADLE